MKLLKIVTSKNFLPVIVVLFLGVLASRTLIFQSGYFNMHDDLQMMRQLEMERCFQDAQIPCRWVPDMGYGFGFPLFNFYPPLPYLVGEIFRVVGFSFVDTAKLLFATAIILSGIFMYLFAKEFFGRIGGVVSAAFYIWAPYHAVDVYVRGAMNESWALVFFPLICWSVYKLIRDSQNLKRWVILLALSYFGLFTSHNLMLMIFTPVFAVYVLLLLWQHNAWKKIPVLLVSGIWAFCLSAFFTIPAIFENKYTQLAGQLVGYYDFTGHFVTINQLLFSTFWGYGPSVWLEQDGMSFQIGYPVWILSLVVGVLLLVRLLHFKNNTELSFLRQLKNDKVFLVSILFLAVGWMSAFMTHSRSTPIWTAVHQLGYLQFSWRFLTLVIFGFSFAIGSIIGIIADWKSHQKWYARLAVGIPQIFVSIVLVLSVVVYSWYYFLPELGHMGKLTDEEKFSAAAWELQQTAGIYDYLPATAKTAPKAPKGVLAEVVDGEGAISGTDQGTYWGLFSAKIESETALVRINIFDFPGMKVYIDGAPATHFIPDEEEWGRMYIVVPNGSHKIYTQLLNTPVRTVSNIVSFVAWLILIAVLLVSTKKYRNKDSR